MMQHIVSGVVAHAPSYVAVCACSLRVVCVVAAAWAFVFLFACSVVFIHKANVNV